MKAIEIANKLKGSKEVLNEIAKIENVVTDLSRVIFIDDKLGYREGDIISRIGNHWEDTNDECFGKNGGYMAEDFGGVPVIFSARNVAGYKVSYFNENWAYKNDVSYEEQEELLEAYQPVYDLIGTNEEAMYECEVIVDNNKKFEIVSIYEPNEEEDFYTIELVEVK